MEPEPGTSATHPVEPEPGTLRGAQLSSVETHERRERVRVVLIYERGRLGPVYPENPVRTSDDRGPGTACSRRPSRRRFGTRELACGHAERLFEIPRTPITVQLTVCVTMIYSCMIYVVCARAPDHIASPRLARAARSRGLQLSCATALDIGHDSCRTGCARQDTSRENAPPNYESIECRVSCGHVVPGPPPRGAPARADSDIYRDPI